MEIIPAEAQWEVLVEEAKWRRDPRQPVARKPALEARVRAEEEGPALLARALANAIEQWPYVRNALEDGRLPLENNLAERAIRPWCVGRRNWLFCDTPSGAEASCAAYSVVATARA